jgi:hypothetical protein
MIFSKRSLDKRSAVRGATSDAKHHWIVKIADSFLIDIDMPKHKHNISDASHRMKQLPDGASLVQATLAALVITYMTWTWWATAGTAQATTLFGLSCAGILFGLFIAAVLVYAVVSVVKRDSDLKEWLSRSVFGKGSDKPTYTNLQVEMTALEKVYQ